MAEQRKQSFVQGAAVLAAAVLIVKIIGAIYKIPLGNILGDEGMAHFGVAYNIYTLLLTVSTAGLPVALSRLISEADALGRVNQVKRIFNVGRMAFLVFGLVWTLFMMIGFRPLSVWMDDPEAAVSILVLGPAVFLVCLMSAYRGYTQGLSDMTPTSVSQVIEVLCKLVFGLALAWLFVRQGMGLPIASAGAILGVTIGSLLALVYIVVYKRRHERYTGVAATDVPDSRGRILKRLLRIGIPVTIGSAVLNIIALIDTKLILNRLQFGAGFSFMDSKLMYGAFFKVQTLFNMPSAFVVPLSVSVIPAVSAYIAHKNYKSASTVTAAAIKICVLMGLPMAAGMSVLAHPIVAVLYPGTHPEGPASLAILGVASFFVCLTMMTNSILQAYGHELVPVVTMPIGGVVKIILNWVLISDPAIGVRGAAWSSIVCYLLICAINIAFICLRVPERPRMLRIFVKPVIAVLIMSAAAWLSFRGLSALLGMVGLDMMGRLGQLIALAGAIVVAVIVYFLAILLLKAISREELELVPKGDKLAKLLKIR